MAAAQSGNPVSDIQAKLSTQIKVTKTAADRSDIVTAGDVVQLHKPGLLMYSVASPLPPSNTYKNGKIGQGMGGFGKDLLIGMLTPGGTTPAQTYPQRQFVPEEKCWVTGFQAQKDGILIQLYSDPYDDVRYYANLKIPFPNKKEVPSADAALQLVAEVLTVVPSDDQGAQPADQGAQQAPVPSPAQDGPPPPIAGQYLAPGGSHMLLLADGTFTKFVGGGQGHGQYAVDGNNLTLTFASTGFAQHFKVQGGNLVDVNTQQAWARTGDAPLPDIAPPPRGYATANHCPRPDHGSGDCWIRAAAQAGKDRNEDHLLLQGYEGDLYEWQGQQRGVVRKKADASLKRQTERIDP
jgi:hypothetical protein